MSFSSAAKNEICHLELERDCCLLAELSALLHMTGSIGIKKAGLVFLKIDTENPAVARRVFLLLKKRYRIHAQMEMRENHLKKNHMYTLKTLPGPETEKVLVDTGLMKKGHLQVHYEIQRKTMAKRCCRIAFLRGAFLGGGSITNPERMYHLEFVSTKEEFAQDLLNILNGFDLNAKMIMRKKSFVVYLKEGDNVIKLLTLIGAYGSILNLENIRIIKEMRNNVNRVVNCETANLSKTVNAAMRQVKNIHYIQTYLGLNNLTPSLREVAELRLNYPEASFSELSQLLSNKVGKSGINHRLRKLDQIADDLRKTKGE